MVFCLLTHFNGSFPKRIELTQKKSTLFLPLTYITPQKIEKHVVIQTFIHLRVEFIEMRMQRHTSDLNITHERRPRINLITGYFHVNN